ncbi:MAG TPA: hypothetical protein VLR27_12650, partial [Acidimicrobiales bacterium]|nr:hypothetical protein [Acidimicrobiales bacterium]
MANRRLREDEAELVGVIGLSERQLVLGLFDAVAVQGIDGGRIEVDHPAGAVRLHREHRRSGAHHRELLGDGDPPCVEVDVGPAQSER